MADREKKPEIRFKGFVEEWEKKSLLELGKVESGVGFPEREQGGTYGVPFYKVSDMNVYGNENEMTTANNYVSNEQIAYQKWKPIDEVPAVIFAKVGAAIMLNRKRLVRFPFLIDNNLMAYKFDSSWNVNFGKTLFEKIDLTSLVQVGALPSFNASDVENFEIRISKIKEQEKIGNYFRKLDCLITLHQRKYDKLVNVKKSMFEKMFPKDGTDVPEVRFKGFTGSWKQCELGQVLTERKILQKISEDAPVLAFAAGQGVIDRSERKSNNRDHLTLDPTNKTYLLTEYNDIVYNPSNLKYGAIDRNKYGRGVISPIYVTFTTEEEPSFIELIVKSEKFKLRALQYEEGTVVKRQSVKPENLLSLNVTISKSKEEQKKIGEYFEKFDKLITLHQREIEKLKNIKKACLEKMFV